MHGNNRCSPKTWINVEYTKVTSSFVASIVNEARKINNLKWIVLSACPRSPMPIIFLFRSKMLLATTACALLPLFPTQFKISSGGFLFFFSMEIISCSDCDVKPNFDSRYSCCLNRLCRITTPIFNPYAAIYMSN